MSLIGPWPGVPPGRGRPPSPTRGDRRENRAIDQLPRTDRHPPPPRWAPPPENVPLLGDLDQPGRRRGGRRARRRGPGCRGLRRSR
ncbi:MAG TPA: hypothetical protein VE152_12760, partial [Acidimicrobiales bacterium]|nr:hypothetical protein [Acidimicrobiales bacterium]